MKRSALADKYLTGLKGVEIGGSTQNAFGLDTVNVDYTRESHAAKRGIEAGHKPMYVDFVAYGDDLPFPDKSYDFVISSHVIEHFYDPMKALIEWQRVAKKYIFIICPHKNRMFDKDKETTIVDELIHRHFTPDTKKEHCHQSFWDTRAFVELCEFMNFNIVEVQDVDDKVGNGFTVVINLRKEKSDFEYFESLPAVIPNGGHKESQKALLTLGINNIGFEGVVCEFGVFRGITARHIIASVPGTTPIYLFDSFDGLPENWKPNNPAGTFKMAAKDIPVFAEKNVKLIKGLFSDTLKPLPFEGGISFLHIDSDIYSSAKTVLTQCNDRIKPGTIIVFDEFYNYDGYTDHEYKALIEWTKEFNRSFEYIGRSHSEQAAIRVLK